MHYEQLSPGQQQNVWALALMQNWFAGYIQRRATAFMTEVANDA